MGDGTAETLLAELGPVVGALGLELVDVEQSAATVRVTVDREGGIDLEGLAEANRAVSAALDRLDPLPGRYTLEVSSPGVERRLRTPGHFARALGETVSVRLVPGAGEIRRVRGRLAAADDTGVVIEDADVPGGSATLAYGTIERARTVFEWGAVPAPSPSRAKRSKAKERVRTS
jgi:ribosome maturation factor RimP